MRALNLPDMEAKHGDPSRKEAITLTQAFDPPLTSVELARFWKKVQKTDSCWVWQASGDPLGYGRIRIRKHLYQSHRLSYLLAHGPLAMLKLVLHKCDNPKCVNPEHLWLGTQGENIEDCRIKGRIAQGASHPWRTNPELVRRGDTCSASKLSSSQVIAIRNRCENGEPQHSIALELGMSRAAVSMIVTRKTWRHI